MRLYKIGEFSEIVGVSASTLRNWHKQDRFVPAHISDSGTRYYSDAQINLISEQRLVHTTHARKIAGYCSAEDIADLNHQIEAVGQYMASLDGSVHPMLFADNADNSDHTQSCLKYVMHLILSDSISELVMCRSDVMAPDVYSAICHLVQDDVKITIIEEACRRENCTI